MNAPLPRWTEVLTILTGSTHYTPRCELCGWNGSYYNDASQARKACHDHARTKRHREDASAITRAEYAEASK